MAIYAEKTTFRSSAYIPDIKINGSTPNNQDILIWSTSEQAFVNGNISCILPPSSGVGGGGYGTIIDGVNLGAGAEVYAGLDSSGMIMQFRSITGSDGITVVEDGVVLGEINITNDIITDAEISVPDSFQLIIDNDDTTDTSAVFELLSNYSVGNIQLVPVTYVDDTANPVEIIADPALVLPGQIKVTGIDLVALGFVPGMCLELFGTDEQDGTWEIDTLTTDTITITVPFPDATDAGFQPTGVSIEGMFFEVLTSNSFQLEGTDLAGEGFELGQTFVLAGTTNGNDGTYTIANIVFDTVTIAETFAGTIGCDVSTISIASAPEILPVGWCVNEIGEMKANDTTITGIIDVSDDIIIQGMTLAAYIDLLTPDFPENGLITQTTDGIFVGRELVGGTGVIVTNPDGLAGDPTINVDDFTITLAGELEGNVTIAGLADGILTAALADLPQFAGLNGNSYNRVTIDGAGRVTAGVNQQMLGDNGIIVVNGDGVSGAPIISAEDFVLTFDGDVSGANTVVGLGDTTVTLSLPDLGVPGTYNTVTVDDKGRVTTGSNATFNFQPLDADLTVLAGGFVDPGIVVWDGSGYVDRIITVGTGLLLTNGDGAAGDININVENFIITLSGELEGSVNIVDLEDGILNASLADLPQFAVLDGNEYNRVTIDGAGRVTAGVNQPLVGVGGIFINNADGVAGSPVIGAPAFELTFNGDVFGQGTVTNLGNTAIDLNLPELLVADSFNHVTVDSKGRVVSGYTHPLDFQPADPNLDTLAAGFINPGFVTWNGSDYQDRRIVGNVDEIIVANSDGAAQDAQIRLADNTIMPGLGAITIPSGGTAQRPGIGASGMIRHNVDGDELETWIAGAWAPIVIGPIPPHLEIAGGTMEGDINMEDNNITFTTGLVDGRDVSADGAILDAINTGTGIKVQVAPDTFENREITTETLQGVTVTDGDGIADNPKVGFGADNFLHQTFEPNYVEDKVIYYDESEGTTKTAPVGKINRRQAFSYFMSQL